MTGIFDGLWIYFLAPALGAALAIPAYRIENARSSGAGVRS